MTSTLILSRSQPHPALAIHAVASKKLQTRMVMNIRSRHQSTPATSKSSSQVPMSRRRGDHTLRLLNPSNLHLPLSTTQTSWSKMKYSCPYKVTCHSLKVCLPNRKEEVWHWEGRIYQSWRSPYCNPRISDMITLILMRLKMNTTTSVCVCHLFTSNKCPQGKEEIIPIWPKSSRRLNKFWTLQ